MALGKINPRLVSCINFLCGLWKVAVCWIVHCHVVSCPGSQSTNEINELGFNDGKATVSIDQFYQLMVAFPFIHLNIFDIFYEPTNNK